MEQRKTKMLLTYLLLTFQMRGQRNRDIFKVRSVSIAIEFVGDASDIERLVSPVDRQS